jgi:hypothetical protein
MDGLDDIPFGPQPAPEQIPLVVPDIDPPKYKFTPCSGIKRGGLPCGSPSLKGTTSCLGHTKFAPGVRAAWAKKGGGKPEILKFSKLNFTAKPLTKDEVLSLVSQRIILFMKKWGDVQTLETEEVICKLVTAYAKVCGIETSEAAAKLGWQMKGTG